jgi:ribosomal protein S18 acetylase RimI-like enzyme
LTPVDAIPASSFDIHRCNPARDKLVLAFAAEVWPEAERAAHWHAISELMNQGRADQVVLLAARQGESLRAVLLAQVLVGNSALVWPPQFAASREQQGALAGALFAQLDRELSVLGIHLAQALIASEHESAAAYLQQGGFIQAAELLYLASPLQAFPDHPLNLPFEMETFNPASPGRLVRLIDRTYQGTLDCPRLDGLRDTADVVQGYQAVGEFQPELWQIARHGGQDVGCLLVNLHPDLKQAEIVYAALVPEVRGRGWGLELTRHAQWLARVAECEQAVLAVDAANAPAIRMYAAAGFTQWDRKAVWLRTLR